MGYRSEVALCLDKNGKSALKEKLEEANKETQKIARELLAQSDKHLADSENSSELWFWDWIKWYPDYPEIRFMENLLDQMDTENFLFIRIGEDSDDSEVQGAYWDNPFGMYLSRSIEFS